MISILNSIIEISAFNSGHLGKHAFKCATWELELRRKLAARHFWVWSFGRRNKFEKQISALISVSDSALRLIKVMRRRAQFRNVKSVLTGLRILHIWQDLVGKTFSGPKKIPLSRFRRIFTIRKIHYLQISLCMKQMININTLF